MGFVSDYVTANSPSMSDMTRTSTADTSLGNMGGDTSISGNKLDPLTGEVIEAAPGDPWGGFKTGVKRRKRKSVGTMPMAFAGTTFDLEAAMQTLANFLSGVNGNPNKPVSTLQAGRPVIPVPGAWPIQQGGANFGLPGFNKTEFPSFSTVYDYGRNGVTHV